MLSLYVICYKSFNEPKMDSFKSDKDTLEFIKASKDETVVDNIFSIDCFGNVKTYVLKFNGQFFLEEVGEE